MIRAKGEGRREGHRMARRKWRWMEMTTEPTGKEEERERERMR